ncbi:hypothetical protein LOAG_05183 [Loa loa]|uniref:MAM domain-containing protein n=1 Tax=Loa loa TaxID=7209 RepID=A0A1S0U0L4_LOALO|nr:hypothetical protein LOAG_05183 [Loa loa]EFO23304.1 hypothetical protein LOAG_05183 [Loa loa]
MDCDSDFTDSRSTACISSTKVEILKIIGNKSSKNTNSRLNEGANGQSTFFGDLKDFGRITVAQRAVATARNLFGESEAKHNFFDTNGVDSVNKSLISFLTSGHRKRLFPLHTSQTSRKSISKLSLERIDTHLISPCSFTDCSFDAVNMCNYVSDDQLQNDEDLLLDGWFAYAGETNNPATIFLMRTSKTINIPEESRVSFYVHMAGKYGRLRVCLDSLQKCPFERTGQTLSVKTRKWTNFHINISRGFHTIYFVADKLKKNYVIGLDNIHLLINHGEVFAPCSR